MAKVQVQLRKVSIFMDVIPSYILGLFPLISM